MADETDAGAVDGEGAVESLLDLDAGARQAAAGLRGNVEEVSLEADRIVPSNHALLLETEILFHHEEVKTHTEVLKRLTKAVAPDLVNAFGIAPDVGAELVVTASTNTGRIRSEAAFARMCGACPIPASSV